MVLRPPGSASIRLTRVAHSNPDRHPPSQAPHTRHTQRQMREIPTPPLTNDSPYQVARPFRRRSREHRYRRLTRFRWLEGPGRRGRVCPDSGSNATAPRTATRDVGEWPRAVTLRPVDPLPEGKWERAARTPVALQHVGSRSGRAGAGLAVRARPDGTRGGDHRELVVARG
jgi:hypothetical protein